MLAVQQRDTDVFQSQYLDPSLLSPPPSSATSISLPTTVPLKRKTRPISSNAEAGPSRPPPPPCRTERRFTCDYPGCDKAYFKPSRLAEHQLTHSGERPHQCPHCAQCYLRASHLHAHLRTHLSQDDKQFTCSRPGCDKKFWTATHLKRHDQTHDQAPVYSCKHCEESFTKVHLLRDHVVLAHMPAGTKPYMCTNEGCDSSFSLKSHLKTHMKTHDATRYTCSHPSHDVLPSFPNWTALQAHHRDAHPPTCPYEECLGRTFKSAHALRTHLKVHADHEIDLATTASDDVQVKVKVESGVDLGSGLERNNDSKRRKSGNGSKSPRLARVPDGDAGKEWSCEHDDCEKRFKSKYALNTHVKTFHLKIKIHSCPHPSCDKSYAHAANLRQHLLTHSRPPSPARSVDLIGLVIGSVEPGGTDYRRYGCPVALIHHDQVCEGRFWRVYDVRRHFAQEHEIVLEDSEMRELLSRGGA